MGRTSVVLSILISNFLIATGAVASGEALVLARQMIPVSQELIRAATILRVDPTILEMHYPVGGDIAFDVAQASRQQAYRFSAYLAANRDLSDAELLAVVAMLPKPVQDSLAHVQLPAVPVEYSGELIPGPRPRTLDLRETGSPVTRSGPPRTTIGRLTSVPNFPTEVSNLPAPVEIQAGIDRARSGGPRKVLDHLRSELVRIRMILTEVAPGETPAVEMDGGGRFVPTSRFSITEEARALLLGDVEAIETEFRNAALDSGTLDFFTTGNYTTRDAAQGRILKRFYTDIDHLKEFLSRSDLVAGS